MGSIPIEAAISQRPPFPQLSLAVHLNDLGGEGTLFAGSTNGVESQFAFLFQVLHVVTHCADRADCVGGGRAGGEDVGAVGTCRANLNMREC